MTAGDAQAALELARAHQAAGRLGEAQRICREILGTQPAQPQALLLLGVLAGQHGRHDEALEWLGRAVAGDPASAEANMHFGIALLRHGRPEQAAAAFRAVIGVKPGYAEAHGNLGVALANLGRMDEAVAAFRAAVQIRPDYGDAWGNLGGAQLRQGRLDEAVAACRRAIALKPGSTAAWNNLGTALKGQGRTEEAITAFRQALALEPGLAAAHSNLAGVLREQGRLDEALAAYRQAIHLDPRLAMAHCNLGAALEEAGQLEAASAALDRAIALDPKLALSHCYLGGVRRAQGELHGAEAAFRTAIRLQPNLAHAHAHLATLLRERLPAADRRALEARLGDMAQPAEQRARLLFGLAQVMDATGDYAGAAACLREANALDAAEARRRGRAYQPGEHEKFVDGVLEVFNAEFFARVRGGGLDARRPVFVVGLPRSGTSLVEQVLASHPQVYGAGELRLVRCTFDAIPEAGGHTGAPLQSVPALDAPAMERLARQHLEALQTIDGGRAARVVDKMPDNYLFLGLLAALFPRATIIHCRRDWRDVAVSCWMTDFVGVEWASDAEHLARRFGQYRRVMDHWARVLPVEVCTVDYEQIVEDLEGQARRLVAACGLEWDEACLAFHQTRRAVRTASGAQVRRPIYKSSVGRWKNYEQELADLFARLPNAHVGTEGAAPGGEH